MGLVPPNRWDLKPRDAQSLCSPRSWEDTSHQATEMPAFIPTQPTSARWDKPQLGSPKGLAEKGPQSQTASAASARFPFPAVRVITKEKTNTLALTSRP